MRKSTNRSLVKLIFETVTMVKEDEALDVGLTYEKVMSAACSLEDAEKYGEGALLETLRRTWVSRGVIEQMKIPCSEHLPQLKNQYVRGTVNKFFLKPTYGADADGFPKVLKIDGILDARECNKLVIINKPAVDYMREQIPFIG